MNFCCLIYYESVIDRYSNWFVLAQRPIAISIVEPDVYEQEER